MFVWQYDHVRMTETSISFLRCLCFLVPHDEANEVAANAVANHDAYVEKDNVEQICLPETYWHCQIIECIGNAVGESANDEDGNSEEKRQPTILKFCELNGCCHDESATDCKQSTWKDACLQSGFEYSLSHGLKVVWRSITEKCHEECADDVAEKYEWNLLHCQTFRTAHEADGAGVELESIMDNCQKAECEENCTDDVLAREEAEAGNSDANACKD